MIEVAQEVVRKSDIHNIEFHHDDIFDPNLIDGSNVTIGFNVLHYVQDPGKVLDRITKLLVPGGLFISSTGCIKESKAGFKSLIFLLKKSQITPPMTPFSHKK